MYLDVDVQLLDHSLSLDAYLARARGLGDEALFDDQWQLLFSSNAPHKPSWGPCTGLFWVRNTATACGVVRNWWNSDWPDSGSQTWEQGPIAWGVHAHNRAYGSAVRVMPTARAWRREDIPKLGYQRGAPPAGPRDPLFDHR